MTTLTAYDCFDKATAYQIKPERAEEIEKQVDEYILYSKSFYIDTHDFISINTISERDLVYELVRKRVGNCAKWRSGKTLKPCLLYHRGDTDPHMYIDWSGWCPDDKVKDYTDTICSQITKYATEGRFIIIYDVIMLSKILQEYIPSSTISKSVLEAIAEELRNRGFDARTSQEPRETLTISWRVAIGATAGADICADADASGHC